MARAHHTHSIFLKRKILIPPPRVKMVLRDMGGKTMVTTVRKLKNRKKINLQTQKTFYSCTEKALVHRWDRRHFKKRTFKMLFPRHKWVEPPPHVRLRSARPTLETLPQTRGREEEAPREARQPAPGYSYAVPDGVKAWPEQNAGEFEQRCAAGSSVLPEKQSQSV